MNRRYQLTELPNALAKHAATIGVASDIFQKIQAKTNNIALLRALRDDAKNSPKCLMKALHC